MQIQRCEREGVLDPASSVVDQDVDGAEVRFGGVEQLAGGVGVAQILLDGHGTAPAIADGG